MAAPEPSRAQWSAVVAATGLLAAVVMGLSNMAFWSNLFRASADSESPGPTPVAYDEHDPFAAARRRMVERQLRSRDIRDADVLGAMGRVARERFVPQGMERRAYDDRPLPIGLGQTISQPYIVALMTQLARPAPESRALEVGVGSGYQTAILAELCEEVYGIEILDTLARGARRRLVAAGYHNVAIRTGDGYRGWPTQAPFDVILVTAAPDHTPQPLLDQLASGGRLVLPVGRGYQELVLIEKRPDGSFDRQSVAPVQFVPMTGEAEQKQAMR